MEKDADMTYPPYGSLVDTKDATAHRAEEAESKAHAVRVLPVAWMAAYAQLAVAKVAAKAWPTATACTPSEAPVSGYAATMAAVATANTPNRRRASITDSRL